MNTTHPVSRWHGTENAAPGGWVRRMKFEPLLEYLEGRQNVLPKPCLAQYAQLQQIKLADSIALERYLAFFNMAAHALGDFALGMRIGLNNHCPSLLPLHELFLNGPTVHDALLALNNGTTALQDSTRTGMWIEGGNVHVFYQLPPCSNGDARQDVEFSLGMLIGALREHLGARWLPQEIHFRHTVVPAAREELLCLLGGDVHIEDMAASNCIVFAGRLLSHVCMPPAHDENALIFFRQYIHDLCSVHTLGNIHDKLRHLLEQHLRGKYTNGQSPSLEWAASRLHLSPRSLQRKLSAEQVTFSSVLEQVRQDLALEWIRHPDTQIGDLAEHLGYADNAAFCNAFKRWAGVSPSRWRRNAPAPISASGSACLKIQPDACAGHSEPVTAG